MYERLTTTSVAVKLLYYRPKWSYAARKALAEYLIEQDEIEHGEESIGGEFNAAAIVDDWEHYESKHDLLTQLDPDLRRDSYGYNECIDGLTDTYTILEFSDGIIASERRDRDKKKPKPKLNYVVIGVVAGSVGWDMNRLTEIGCEKPEHYDDLASKIVEYTTLRFTGDKAVGVVRDSIRHLNNIAAALDGHKKAMEMIQESKPLVVLGQGTSRTEIGKE